MRHDPLAPSETPLGFLEAWEQLIGGLGTPMLAPRRGRKPRVPLGDLLSGLTFHVLQGAGTLSEHFEQLFGAPFADSSWSDRRTRLPWAIFAELMRRALRPRATKRQPEAFWRGWPGTRRRTRMRRLPSRSRFTTSGLTRPRARSRK